MNIEPSELVELMDTITAPALQRIAKLERDLATAKSMGQTEHEANQRLSAKLGDAEKRIAELERLDNALVEAFAQKKERITELEQDLAEAEHQRDEYEARCDDLIRELQTPPDQRWAAKVAELEEGAAMVRDQQAERIAELEAQLQAARAEVSKEREAAGVLAERSAELAKEAYLEGWNGAMVEAADDAASQGGLTPESAWRRSDTCANLDKPNPTSLGWEVVNFTRGDDGQVHTVEITCRHSGELARVSAAPAATLQHAYAEGYWLGRTSLGADPEKGATMPCATCGRDVREWVGSGCESCDPTLHPSWPGAETGA